MTNLLSEINQEGPRIEPELATSNSHSSIKKLAGSKSSWSVKFARYLSWSLTSLAPTFTKLMSDIFGIP